MNVAPSRSASLLPASKLGCLAALVSSIFALSGARAATYTWLGDSGSGASDSFNTAANWSGGVPASGGTLVFGPSGSGGTSLTDNITSLTVGGLNTDGIDFGVSSDSYTIAPSSATITLASSGTGIGISQLANDLVTISVPLALSGNQTIQVGGSTGNAYLSGLSLTGGSTGAYRLTKTGNGVLTFNTAANTANAFSGLTILGGAVAFLGDGELGTAPATFTAGNIVLDGGELNFVVGNNTSINANRGILLGDSGAGTGGTLNNSRPIVLTYNGVLANNGGTDSFTKTGQGLFSLGGPNTYTGSTIINQGYLQLNFAAGATGANATPASNIINSGSTLVMGGMPTSYGLQSTTGAGATLLLSGVNSGLLDSAQTFNGLTLNPGYSSIVVNGGTGSVSATLNLGAITHTAGGTVSFTSLANSGGSGAAGTITTSTTNSNGILGGWATYATGTAATASSIATVGALVPTDWAANDGSGNIVAYTGYTTIGSSASTIANGSSSNVLVNSTSGAVSLASGTTIINTLLVSDSLARTITMGAGNTLMLGASGGIFRSSTGSTTLTFGASVAQGGTLTAGGAANTAGEIVFTNNGPATTNPITVNSVIADNGTGVVDVVKTGPGELTLAATDTYSGGTVVNQGSVIANVAGAFGGGSVTVLPGGGVTLTGGTAVAPLTYANNFTFAGAETYTNVSTIISGTVTLAGDTAFIANTGSGLYNLTISGQVTGAGNLTFYSGGVGILSNTSNNFTGDIEIGAGVGSGGTLGAAAPGRSSTLMRLGANNVLPNGAGFGNVIVEGFGTLAGSPPTVFFNGLDMGGYSATINGLSSTGVVTSAEVINSGSTASTLTLGGNNQSSTFGGRIIDGNGYAATMNGSNVSNPGGFTAAGGSTLAITKIGTGSFTVTGTNAYSGGTLINAGVFRLGAATAMAGSTGLMTVQGGKLDSSVAAATLGGALTMTSGAINPNGTSVGMLTLSSSSAGYTMSGGTLFLTLASTSSYDSIAGSGGAFSVSGGTLDLGGVVGTAGNSYQVLSGFASGSVSNVVFTDYTTSDGSLPSLSTAGLLTFTAVPEPSTWVMGCLLTFASAGYAARRRRQARA